MSNYKLEFTIEEYIGLLSNYYTNFYNKPITVKYTHTKYEEKVTFYFEEKVELLGHIAIKTTTLSKEDMISALNTLLEDRNFEVIKIKPKIRTEHHGYYYDDYSYYYFEGIELELKELEKIYKKKM